MRGGLLCGTCAAGQVGQRAADLVGRVAKTCPPPTPDVLPQEQLQALFDSLMTLARRVPTAALVRSAPATLGLFKLLTEEGAMGRRRVRGRPLRVRACAGRLCAKPMRRRPPPARRAGVPQLLLLLLLLRVHRVPSWLVRSAQRWPTC
jgi:hypothetical protein